MRDGDGDGVEEYGIDGDGDGIMDFKELQAYMAFKAKKLEEALAHDAAVEAGKAAMKKEMLGDYETVPGFVDRRGWHGNDINEHNYGEHLTAKTAVHDDFPGRVFNQLPAGPMAKIMGGPAAASSSMDPRGRARARGGGGIDDPVSYYEPDRLVAASTGPYSPTKYQNAFDSRLFSGR